MTNDVDAHLEHRKDAARDSPEKMVSVISDAQDREVLNQIRVQSIKNEMKRKQD